LFILTDLFVVLGGIGTNLLEKLPWVVSLGLCVDPFLEKLGSSCLLNAPLGHFVAF